MAFLLCPLYGQKDECLMTRFISFTELGSSRALIALKAAALIVASCEASFDEPAVLYDSGKLGLLVEIELEAGDLIFETSNLHQACNAVIRVKGECHFSMRHTGVAAIPDDQWPDGGKATQANTEGFDDDHDSADWWKRGAK